jgi:hypothetical protein
MNTDHGVQNSVYRIGRAQSSQTLRDLEYWTSMFDTVAYTLLVDRL